MKPYKNLLNQLLLIAAITITSLLSLLINEIFSNNIAFAREPEALYGSNVPTPRPNNDDDSYTVYEIANYSEWDTVLNTAADPKLWLGLEDNIFIPDGQTFNVAVPANRDLVIELGMWAAQTSSDFVFEGPTTGKATVSIIGSSMFANGGFQITGNVELNYFGIYSSGRADVLGKNNTDDVTFNLTGIGGRWDANAVAPKFVNRLPVIGGTEIYDKGTIVIGEAGKATVNVWSGNTVESGEVIIGARNTGNGTLNLSGIYEVDDKINPSGTDEPLRIKDATEWLNSGTFYIGYTGTGVANISHGAILKTGSIGVGILEDSNGTLKIEGISDAQYGTGNDQFGFLDKTKNDNFIIVKGKNVDPRDKDYIAEAEIFNPDTTKVYIFGRDDENNTTDSFLFPNDLYGLTTLKSEGDGKMEITGGAIVVFDETQNKGNPSGYTPKITLGDGNSIVDNSIIIGARDERQDANDAAGFEDVGLIDGMKVDNTTFNDNSLTFRNNAVLQGNLKVYMKNNTFADTSILTPGFGSYDAPKYVDADLSKLSTANADIERFGRVDFKNETFTHTTGATTIIDFDIHGDRNFDASKQTAYTNGGDVRGYVGDDPTALYQGRDLINIEGNANLAGDIYLRPQSGYYSDNIKVDFMRVTGTITDQYDNLHLYPYRWFKNHKLEIEDNNGVNYNQLVAERNTTPFTDVARNFNQHGVGGALNNIYNAQSNYKWLPILDWMWCMDDNELREAERLLGGESKAASYYMALRSPWRFGFDRVNWSDRGHKVYFGPQSKSQVEYSRSTLWATSYFDYQSIDNDHNSSSAATQRVSLMAGYDIALPGICDIGFVSDSAFGVLFSYSQPKLDQHGSRVVADDYLIGFHSAARVFSTYELKSWIGVGAQQYRLTRNIPIPNQNPTLTSKYKGNNASGSIQLARPVNWYGITFRPHIALDAVYTKQYGARESYNGAVMEQVALTYHSSGWQQYFGRTGLRFDISRKSCSLYGTLGYSYLLLGDQAPESTHEFTYAGGGQFKIQGNNPNRSFVNLDLGGQIHLNKKKSRLLYLQYNSNYGKYLNAHTATIGYQFMF
jgi:hypothetical protein